VHTTEKYNSGTKEKLSGREFFFIRKQAEHSVKRLYNVMDMSLGEKKEKGIKLLKNIKR